MKYIDPREEDWSKMSKENKIVTVIFWGIVWTSFFTFMYMATG